MIARETCVGVIGGSGFIGSWLGEALLRLGYGLRIIDIAPSERFPDLWVAADVRDPAGLQQACRGCHILYNLAAEHRDDVRPRERYHEVNVQGAENTCAAADALGIEQIIFASSVAVYGLPEGIAGEEAPLRPFNDYGRTKLEAEGVFRRWAGQAPQRRLAIIRPTVVFGPGNRGNVYLLLRQIASGRRILIGDGSNRKSMAYVANVAGFLVHALRFGPGVQVYNYVDKPDVDMKGLLAIAQETLGSSGTLRVPYALGLTAGLVCDAVAQVSGRRFPISAVRVRKYAASTQFAAERALSTGFEPPYALKDALISTIRHEFADAATPISQPSQAPVPPAGLSR